MFFLEQMLAWLHVDVTPPVEYGWFHLICLFILAAACAAVIVWRKKITDRVFFIIALSLWILLVVGEVYKQLDFSYDESTGKWEYLWYAFPFQFCSTILYVLPLAIFIGHEGARAFFYAFLATFSLFAGLIVMLFPGDVFCPWALINVQTMVHHGGMVFFGVLLYATEKIPFRFSTLLRATAVFAVLFAIAMLLNLLFRDKGGFNMFYIDVEGCHLPVLSELFVRLPYPVFLALYAFGFCLVAGLVLLIAWWVTSLSKKLRRKEGH